MSGPATGGPAPGKDDGIVIGVGAGRAGGRALGKNEHGTAIARAVGPAGLRAGDGRVDSGPRARGNNGKRIESGSHWEPKKEESQ